MESSFRKNIFFIIVGLILLSAAIALECFISDKEQYHNTNCTQAAYDMLLVSPEVSIEEAEKKAPTKENKQKHFENTATCSDLGAQWRVAVITQRAYYIGLIGIFLIFATWIATRQAVDVSKDAARKQLRAYVSVENVELVFKDDSVFGRISYKNTGQTPALKVENTYRIEIFDPRKKNDFSLDKEVSQGPRAKGALGPSIRFYTRTKTKTYVPESQIKDFTDGFLAIFVYGECTYEDIYGNVRKTTFRRGWGNYFFNMDTPDMGVCEEGNEMT